MRLRPHLLAAALLCASAPLLSGATTESPAPLSAKAQAELAGRTAGTPVSCVDLKRLGATRIVDATAVIYKQSPRLWYVNQPDQGRCDLLRPNRTLISTTSTGRLCAADLVTIADPNPPISYGACSLGQFVPYTR